MSRFRLGLLTLAVSLTLSACGARGGHAPSPFPGTRPLDGTDAATRPGDPTSVANTALSLQGTPYVWGGTTPKGFDCSGFTRYVYAQHGIPLPRTAAHQYRVGARVSPRDIRPGDLVFFSTVAPGPSHVGLAIGDGRFVHAPSERSKVRVESLDTRYWQRRYLGARRIASAPR
jgi:cell wall-associated NlpC family hydrolase